MKKGYFLTIFWKKVFHNLRLLHVFPFLLNFVFKTFFGIVIKLPIWNYYNYLISIQIHLAKLSDRTVARPGSTISEEPKCATHGTELAEASVTPPWHRLPTEEEHSHLRITLSAPETPMMTWSLQQLGHVLKDLGTHPTPPGASGNQNPKRALTSGPYPRFPRNVLVLPTLPDVQLYLVRQI